MRASHLEDFYSFLRFPSISTDDDYSERVSECAHWLVEKLTGIGLKAELVPTPGHPVVWARNQHREGRRTVLIYGHYDVQPPDPLELWDSPPFDPVLKDGYVFARGATDNKGQILSHILGIQETIEEDRELPINLHLVIEGEEEIGSANLGKFLIQNRDSLKSDVAVVSDTGMITRGVPTLTYGLRGVTALEIKVTGPKMDLHSGVFGGAVANPITAIAKVASPLRVFTIALNRSKIGSVKRGASFRSMVIGKFSRKPARLNFSAKPVTIHLSVFGRDQPRRSMASVVVIKGRGQKRSSPVRRWRN